MKLIKKLVASTTLALSMLLSLNASATSVLVSQEVLVDGSLFAEVSLEFSRQALSSGDIVDSFFDEQPTFAGIDFTGIASGFVLDEVFGFEAVFDTSASSFGLDFLDLDLNAVVPGVASFSFLFGADTDPDFGFGFLDIFDNADSSLVFFSSDVTFGAVTVDSPNVALVLLMAFAGMFVTVRKKQLRLKK